MGLINNRKNNKIYASVLSSDGSIRVKVDENTEGSIRRDYETPSGEKGFKFERVYTSLEGFISRINFKEIEYGKFLEIDMIDNEKVSKDNKITCLSLNVETIFAIDLMKRLPNIDLEKSVILYPYSFDSKKTDKTLKGTTVYQNEKKIKNFFYDEVNNKNINGFPPVDREKAKTYDKDDWKIYFLSVKKFLIAYTEDNIIPKVEKLNRFNDTDEINSDLSSEEITVGNIEKIMNTPSELSSTKTSLQDSDIEEEPFITKSEEEALLITIAEIAKEKLGALKPEDVKLKVMSATGLAFVPMNLKKIVRALEQLPNK